MSKWNVTWASVEFSRELCSYFVWKFLQGFGVSQKPNIKKKKKNLSYMYSIFVWNHRVARYVYIFSIYLFHCPKTQSVHEILCFTTLSLLSLWICLCSIVRVYVCVCVCTIQVYLVTSWDRGLICALVPHRRKKPGLSHYVCFNLHMLKACRCRSSLCVNDGLIISCRRKGLG